MGEFVCLCYKWVWLVKNCLFCLCGFDSHYGIGKNIYFLLLCLHSAFFARTKQLDSSISLAWVYLFLLLVVVVVVVVFACTCLSLCVCVFAALLLVVRFVLFLYWYIMEEFELPWAIISFISLLVLCMWLLLLLLCMYLFVSLFISECAVRTADFA